MDEPAFRSVKPLLYFLVRKLYIVPLSNFMNHW